MFLLQSLPHCRPADYERWLRELRARAVRRAGPDRPRRQPAELPPHARRTASYRRAGHASSADEWAEFIQRVYRLDTGPWLQRLIGRPGWHQYVAREDGEIVAARGMHIGPTASPGSGWTARCRASRPTTTSPTRRSAHSSSPTASPGARGFIADIEASAELAVDEEAVLALGRDRHGLDDSGAAPSFRTVARKDGAPRRNVSPPWGATGASAPERTLARNSRRVHDVSVKEEAQR